MFGDNKGYYKDTHSSKQKKGLCETFKYFHHFQVDIQHIQKYLFHNMLEVKELNALAL